MQFGSLDRSNRQKFVISKIKDGVYRNLEKSKYRQILAAVWAISTKFCTVTQLDILDSSDC